MWWLGQAIKCATTNPEVTSWVLGVLRSSLSSNRCLTQVSDKEGGWVTDSKMSNAETDALYFIWCIGLRVLKGNFMKRESTLKRVASVTWCLVQF